MISPGSVAWVDEQPLVAAETVHGHGLREEGAREVWAAILVFFLGFFVFGTLAASVWIGVSGGGSAGVGAVCARSSVPCRQVVIQAHNNPPDVPTTTASLVGAYGAILGGLAVVHRSANRRSARSFREHYGFRVGGIGLLGLGAAVGVASQIGIAILQSALRHVDKAIQPSEQSLDIATSARNDGPLAIAALCIAFGLLAPVVEELFYRGLLHGALRKRFGSVIAVAVSSLVFGFSHLQSLDKAGVFTGGALALFGLALALLVERYRILGPAIAAHIAFNVFSLVLLFR